jgi:hypothetical protein
MSEETNFYPAVRLEEARLLLARSTDDLLETLGKDLPRRGLPEDVLNAGRQRYQAVIKRCQSSICKNKHIHTLCNNRRAGHASHLVCAVADAILHHMGTPLPAMTIAAVVVQSGLDSFCKPLWQDE